MAETHDQNPVDQFLKKTLDTLPDSPAASGWDAPSPAVWTKVQARIQPGSSGNWAKLLGLAAAILVVAGVVYFFVNQGNTPKPTTPAEQPSQPTAEPKVEQPAANLPAENATPTTTSTEAKPASAKPSKGQSPKPKNHEQKGQTAPAPAPQPYSTEPKPAELPTTQPANSAPKTEQPAANPAMQMPTKQRPQTPPPPNHAEMNRQKPGGGN